MSVPAKLEENSAETAEIHEKVPAEAAIEIV